MKLGKTSWIVLTVGIILVAFGSLGIARAQQVDERQRLDDELAVAEVRLSKLQLNQLRSQQSELEKQSEQISLQLTAAKDNFRQPIESIEVTDTLFEIAGASGVEIIDYGSSDLGTGTIEGINCSIIRLNMVARGTVFNLINFVIKLNNDFPTGVVGSVAMDTQALEGEAEEGATENQTEEEEGATENQTEEEDNNPTASITLVVYAYRGS